MPNKESNVYTFIFAIGLVAVVGVGLTLLYSFVKPRQDMNIRLEKMQNILKSAKIEVSREEAEENFNQYIVKQVVIDYQGKEVEGGNAFDVDLAKEIKKPEQEQRYPLYVCDKEGEKYYIIPMRGKGLWGPVWGFVSLKDDFNTIFGATFDHKTETPGLGAEISETEFQQQFEEKKINNENGEFISIDVAKKGKYPSDYPHSVDGISGGTITSNGVDAMLEKYLGAFQIYFANLSKNNMTDNAVLDMRRG